MRTSELSDMRVLMPRPTTFADCPPGFFLCDDQLCLKTEYGSLEAYNSAGERFWGGVDSLKKLSLVWVLPIAIEVEESEPGEFNFHISFEVEEHQDDNRST